MRCHFSYRVELLLAVACVLVALTLFLLTGREARRLSGFFLLILASWLPWCRNPGLSDLRRGTCHTADMVRDRRCVSRRAGTAGGLARFCATGAVHVWARC